MRIDSEIIISDTSCLILLSKIGSLELLNQISSKVYITPEIKTEFGKDLPAWILIKKAQNKKYQEILEMDLDAGESSAIALSMDIDNCILILDDLKGRKVADKLKLRYAGTFGLILKAKRIGAIETVKPILDKIKQTNFRFDEKLFQIVLKEANE